MNLSPSKKNSRWIPLLLSGLVMPGFGQIYIKEKVKGYLIASFTLLVLLGGFARFMSVLFALANLELKTRAHALKPFQLLARVWALDHRVLLYFGVALVAIWILSIVDLLLPRKDLSHEKS